MLFGLLKLGGSKTIDNTRTYTLMPIIKGKIIPNSIVDTDCYHSYNAFRCI